MRTFFHVSDIGDLGAALEEAKQVLATSERTILLRMHSQFEEFFVVLSILPAILIHFLLEAFKCIGNEGVRICIGKLTLLRLGQFDKFRCNLTRHLTTLAENHAPDGIVHHYIAALALLHSEKVHQGDVLGIL